MNVKKFVINLDRRKDRYEEFKKKCPYEDVERISAFDGMNPLMNDNLELYNFLRVAFPNLDPGEYGCWVSHLKIWKKIITDNLPCAIIFEDDPIFCDDFKNKCNKLIHQNLKKIDTILYIGGQTVPDFVMERGIDVAPNLVKYDYNREYYSDDCARGTFCYLITKKTCEYFLRCLVLKIKGTKSNAIDIFMMNMLMLNECNIFSAKPLLCHSLAESPESDIRQKDPWWRIELGGRSKVFKVKPGPLQYIFNLQRPTVAPISEIHTIKDSHVQNLKRLNNGQNPRIINKELRWRAREDARRQRMRQNFRK